MKYLILFITLLLIIILSLYLRTILINKELFYVSVPNQSYKLLKGIKNLDIKMVDLRFTDMPGTTHHITIPIKFLVEDLFTNGVGFDGSSVRGFRSIENRPDFKELIFIISVPLLKNHCS